VSLIAQTEARARSEVRRRIRFVVLVLVLIVVVLAVVLLGRQAAHKQAASAAARSAAAAANAAAKPPAADPRSIAVLPFENLSEDKANAFFADGIQDEILTSLAKIGGLKVISRTSTLKYASHPEHLGKIAAELGVARIVEGSVQKAGDTVRINVQLIDAASDSHLWAESYDRKLDDIFAVQSEVAQAVAKQLQANLTSAEQNAVSAMPTRNAQAYEDFLLARSLLDGAHDRAAIDRGLAALDRAVRADPQFLQAWSDLAQGHALCTFLGSCGSKDSSDLARRAAARAQALAPDSPDAVMARASVTYMVDNDFQAAASLFRRAREARPNDARAWLLSALLDRHLGRWSESLAEFRRARLLSPNDQDVVIEYVVTLSTLRLDAEAGQAAQAALALQPDDPSMLFIAWLSAWTTQGAKGGAAVRAAQSQHGAYVTALRARQAWYEHDLPRAFALWQRALAAHQDTNDVGHFNALVPGRIEWQLQYATALRAGDPTASQKQFREVAEECASALKHPSSKYNEAAWRLAHAWALAGLGDRQAAIDEAKRGVALVPAAEDPLEGPTFLEYQARALATAGEQDAAIDLLSKLLYTTGSWMTPQRLASEPTWDPLRGNRRFEALLQDKGSKLTPWDQ